MGLLGAIAGTTRVQIIQNNNTVIQLDASIKELHQRESPPTEFPVENGTTISDHVIIKPLSLELTGIISDTPISGANQLLTEAATTLTSALLPPVGLVVGSAAYALYKSLSDSKSPSVAAYNQLLQLQENAQPVDVLTSLFRYTNMWIKSISAPRDADTGKALIFTISLVQLLLVTPQSVSIQIFANPDLAAGPADVGQQDPALANAAKQGHASEVANVRPIVRSP